ncbi:PREDICTED: nucleolar protein 14 [Gekko japonicus]|uniref:Nucleolar protein 14 n=1 Tax=Gekko japonicus TaxID=146911 RepID=A0ABM1KQZ7_GEKJA|nr:PREDICTED: nucleolar protein 14 [Gekko japonicus]
MGKPARGKKSGPGAFGRGPGPAAGSVRGNPFEVKVNKQKFRILGRKTKHDVGLPGVSRSKAHRKRTQTLLKEYKEKDKSSVFKDKRIGEYDTKISPEEKMMKRFALEQQKSHEKKSIYNLNEEEDLTHYGQSLADIEKLNDVLGSDSDSEETGMLSAELTAAHFGGGGGLLRKKALLGQENEKDEKCKSRKELIEELIAKSKQEKRERQAQRENTLELTEKLDNDWKEIQAFLSHKGSKSETKHKVEEKVKPDEYDMIVRELGFEMKAQPCGRMKTEEELAKEEQERLLQLEAERLRRMHGEDDIDTKKKPKHISADDLADGFILDKDDRRLLSYNDGRLNIEDDKDEDVEESVGRTEDDSEEEEEESEEGSGSDADAVDSHSDLESDDGSVEKASAGEEREKINEGSENKSPSKDQNAKKKAAGLELPYTLAAPGSYEQLKALLLGRPVEEQLLVIEKIKKSNHPSFAVANKAKLEKLFGFLLEYIVELTAREPPELKTIDKLVLVLYDLCQMFPEAASNHVKLVLQDAAHDMEEILETRGRAPFPGLDMLIYLKIVAILFPTSDYWHPVVTPSMVYMSQLLTKCPVTTLQDVVKGLFVCCLFLQYVSVSQRFIPELVNFLLRILHTAVPSRGVQGLSLMHPFRSLDKNCSLLVISETADTKTWQKQNLPLRTVIGSKENSRTEVNHLRLSCIDMCLNLVKRCAVLYGSLPSFQEVMKPIQLLLSQHVPVSAYPAQLQEFHNSILSQLETQGPPYHPLVCEKSDSIPLEFSFAPRLLRNLEFGRKQGSNEKEQERKRLIHRHKRELKGAVREIRRDNQFLARMQLAEITERDSERKRKVKQLFGSLAEQEGNWKAMKKKKF